MSEQASDITEAFDQAVQDIALLNRLLEVLEEASPELARAAVQEAQSRMNGEQPVNVLSMYVDHGQDF